MGRLLIFLAVLVVGSVESLNSGLRVKFNVGLRPGRDFFFDVPRHVDDAYAKKWSLMSRPASPLPSLIMYCATELVICTLYDPDTRFIAGFQVALPMNDFTGAPYDWDMQGYIPWTPSTSSGTYMTKQLYFINEDTLSKSVEERMQAAVANEVLQEKSLWAMGINKQLIEIPRDADGIVDAGFTKQACIPWMGQHYYYRMSAETQCTAETMLNWFPLVNSGKLIGMGFVSFGALEEKSGEKSGEKFYFERPNRLAVQAIVPRGPQCLYNLAQEPTLTTMHIYFVDKPWQVYCPLF